MADEEDVDELSSDRSGIYTGLINQRIERCLWQLADEPKKDVACELVSECDFETLEGVREKFFEYAKAKAQRNGAVLYDTKGDPVDSDTHTDPWRLIKRRQINLLSMDVCDIYMYITNKVKTFPAKILKRRILLNLKGQSVQNPVLGMIRESEENDTTTNRSTKPGERSGRVDVNGEQFDTESSTHEVTQGSRRNVDGRQARSFVLFSEQNVNEVTGPDLENATTHLPIEGAADMSKCTDKTGRDISDSNHDNMKGSRTNVEERQAGSFILFSEQDGVVGIDANKDCNDTLPPIEGATDVSQGGVKTDGVARISDVNVMRLPPQPQVPTTEKVSANGKHPKNAEKDNECTAHDKGEKQLPPHESEATHNSDPIVRTHNIDNTLLDFSKLSQGSFLRELYEIHNRVFSSTPISKSKEVVAEKPPLGSNPVSEPKNTQVRTMASQTEPNVIYDPAIKKSEFDSQVQYIEQSLTDHERRLRSTEVWRERNDRRVNNIDADYHTQIKEIKTSNETSHSDYLELKNQFMSERGKLRESIRVQEEMSKELADLKQLMAEDREKMREMKGLQVVDYDSKISNSSKDTPKRPSKRRRRRSSAKSHPVRYVSRKQSGGKKGHDDKRGGSVYRSLMKAARSVLSPRMTSTRADIVQQQQIGGNVIPGNRKDGEVETGKEPKNTIAVNAECANQVAGHRNERQMYRNDIASTPIPRQQQIVETSWADDDDDDSRAIEAYLAIIKMDNGADDANTPHGVEEGVRGETNPVDTEVKQTYNVPQMRRHMVAPPAEKLPTTRQQPLPQRNQSNKGTGKGVNNGAIPKAVTTSNKSGQSNVYSVQDKLKLNDQNQNPYSVLADMEGPSGNQDNGNPRQPGKVVNVPVSSTSKDTIAKQIHNNVVSNQGNMVKQTTPPDILNKSYAETAAEGVWNFPQNRNRRKSS